MLRALISRGVFRQRRDGRYELTPLARTLRWDAPDSMAALARLIGSPEDREHWSHCIDAVRTGESVIPTLRGMEGFDWVASQPELGEVFNQAMTNFSELAVDAVTATYDFSRLSHHRGCRAAGTAGCWPASSRRPQRATGVLFDLPHVVAGAEPLLCKHRVAERVRILEGSFFDAVPEGGDLYVLKNIIHDWPDDKAQQILKTLRAAARTGTTVLLVECVIPPHDRDFRCQMDGPGDAGRQRRPGTHR